MTAAMTHESLGQAPGRGRLAGRHILIVGAGQNEYGMENPPPGNGRAVALLAAREGARVALVDRDQDALRATADLVRAEGGNPVEIVADIASEQDVIRMAETAEREMGRIDGLVLVVGIALTGGFDETTVEQWDQVFNVNVRGHFLCVKHVRPRLADGASAVIFSSIAALQPVHELVSYHASKAALEGIKNVFAQQDGPRGVRVNILAPGFIDTAIGRWASEAIPARKAAAEGRNQAIPLGRQGTAWEIAYPTIFLLSDEASYITGQSLFVDGGQTTVRK